jgi:Tol biopolymer transport system component
MQCIPRFGIGPLLILGGLLAALPVPAGVEERRITRGFDPAVSPDGTRLAFTRITEGNADIWVCRLDGSDELRVTEHAARDDAPDWSPDGTRLVFASTRSGAKDLYVMHLDGSTPARRLTDLAGREDDPAWSPDGTTIAFTALEGGREAIGLIPSEGGEPRFLRLHDAGLADPSWSPDGREIVAVTDATGDHDLVVLDVRTERKRPHTVSMPVGSTDEMEPAWHPARSLIAFTSDRDSESPNEIRRSHRDPAEPRLRYLYAAAPGQLRLRVVVDTPRDAAHPDWTPDGRSVVFVHEGRTMRAKFSQRLREETEDEVFYDETTHGARWEPGPGGQEIWIAETVLRTKKDTNRPQP